MLTWMVLSGAIHSAEQPARNDTALIRAVLAATWDKPDAKLVVDPVVVVGAHAVAGWTQGDRGGRALLRKSDGAWKVVLCSGDPLKQASVLAEAGVPQDAAEEIARKNEAAERNLPPEHVRLLSTFEGVMQMHDQGHAPDH